MSSSMLDNPKLFRHVVEDLPVGIFIVDREGLIRFWNHGAEHLTGYLSHEVVGHGFEDVVQACNRRGNRLTGEACPVTMALQQRQPQQCNASYLHKNGHRMPVNIRTRPIVEYGDALGGVTILFDGAFVYGEESSGPPMYGCLDSVTGIPSLRLTRAVLNECMASVAESHLGFGVLRVRVLGLEEFRLKHGPQSVVPFLRVAARTLRNSLSAESFVGCWEESEFLVVLPTASPITVASTAETLWSLLSHSEVSWWGDRFLVQAEVGYTVAAAGSNLETLLREMTPSRSSVRAKATTANAGGDSATLRG
jgi:PAS domain S-box-containing protein